jgi:predicted GNAT superfamily acetyltransferase
MANDSSVIVIRPIREISDLKAVEDLQREIWGCSDLEILPALAMIPLLEIGGVLLGSFAGDEMVGFVLGLPGFDTNRPILHSDMLAVKASYRSHGLGFKLKLSQRQHALSKGIERITWTFDPLQSRNAYLNFGKLGVFSDRYEIDYYGATSSFLHSTGTDRLWVTWDLKSLRVKRRLELTPEQREAVHLTDVPPLVRVSEDNSPQFLEYRGTETASIEIPMVIDSVVETDPALAQRWRETTRVAFTSALDGGLVVQDFFRRERQGRTVGRYLLTRESGSGL